MADPLNILSLFSGVGGLDLGIKIARPDARVLGYVERDAYAASILLGRMEDAALEPAPVYCGDICELDGRDFRPWRPWLVGGFPCQDISVAGRGAGIIEGKRSGLWREYARLLDETDAAGAFIENVAALVHRGLDVVLQDLAELGFDAVWGSFRASDVGAPHKRERVFILAYRPERGLGIGGQSSRRDGFTDGGGQEPLDNAASPRRDTAGQRATALHGSGQCLPSAGCEQLAHAARSGERERFRQQATVGAGRESGPEGLCETLADAEHSGRGPQDAGRGPEQRTAAGRSGGVLEHAESGTGRPDAGRPGESRRRGLAEPDAELGDAAQQRSQGRGSERGRADEQLPFPPGPADADAWARILAANPELAPAVEPGFCVLADGIAVSLDASRADQLRCCGNGVVALQAAFAFEVLSRRAGIMNTSANYTEART